MECSVCYVVTETEAFSLGFKCLCAGAACAGCSMRLHACPWCRAPKRSSGLQLMVGRIGVHAAVELRRQFYGVLRELHSLLHSAGNMELKQQDQAQHVANLYAQCVAFANNECISSQEKACVLALEAVVTQGGGGANADAGRVSGDPVHAPPPPLQEMRLYERILHRHFIYSPGQGRPCSCTACTFVSRVYGPEYVDVECGGRMN
jgi:hypothetical protein